MAYPPDFDNTWDITAPADTQAANLLGQDIRNFKDDIMQRFALLSGNFANRPTPETVNATWGGSGFGILFFAVDTKQIFQWNGSAWVQVTFSGLVASFDTTGQTAVLPVTTIYTPAAAGFYRVSAQAVVKSPTGTSGLSVKIYFTQGGDAHNATPINSSSTAGNLTPYGDVLLYSDAGTPIQYETPYWSSGGAGDSYDLHLRVEAL